MDTHNQFVEVPNLGWVEIPCFPGEGETRGKARWGDEGNRGPETENGRNGETGKRRTRRHGEIKHGEDWNIGMLERPRLGRSKGGGKNFIAWFLEMCYIYPTGETWSQSFVSTP
jgi:hypothetical protein